MMRQMLVLAALAVAIPAAAQTAPEQAKIYADGLQSFVGTKIQGKTKLGAIRAEYDTVVFVVDGQLWPSNPEKATKAWVEGLCQSAPNFFVNGVKLRMHFTGTKKEEPSDGPDVDRCP